MLNKKQDPEINSGRQEQEILTCVRMTADWIGKRNAQCKSLCEHKPPC